MSDPDFALRNFFGGYFHQDWDLEAEDWPGVVDQYLQHASSSEAAALAAEIDALAASAPTDDVLERRLYQDLGCCYMPRPDLGGPTVRAWLTALAAYLRSLAGQVASA